MAQQKSPGSTGRSGSRDRDIGRSDVSGETHDQGMGRSKELDQDIGQGKQELDRDLEDIDEESDLGGRTPSRGTTGGRKR